MIGPITDATISCGCTVVSAQCYAGVGLMMVLFSM